MSKGIRLALIILVALCMLLFLAVSFDNTRRIGALFHMGWDGIAYMFALAVEAGVIVCSIAIVERKFNGQDAGWFAWVLGGALAIACVANLLAGGRAYPPESTFLSDIGLPRGLRWPLIGAFSVLVPVLSYASSHLLATLIVEYVQPTSVQAQPTSTEAQPDESDAQPDASGTRTTRIVQFYQERITQGEDVRAIDTADVARQFRVTPATVRKARAQVIEGGKG